MGRITSRYIHRLTLVLSISLIALIFFITPMPAYASGESVPSTLNSWSTTAWSMSSIAGTYIYTSGQISNSDGSHQFKFFKDTNAWYGNGATITTFGEKLTGLSTSGGDITFSHTQNSYYVFKWNGSDTGVVFKLSNTPVSISSTSLSPSTSVCPAQAVTVNATLSGSFPTGQAGWLRYTTDNWATSTVAKLSGSGTSYSASIPAGVNNSGATVKYYLFTSGDVGSITSSDADLFTINLLNNGGSNYEYTVASSWGTAAAGNWSSASTWTCGAVPSTDQPVTIAHDVTLDQNANIDNLTINSSRTLTSQASSARVLTFQSGSTLQNNGTFTANDGKVIFTGTGTIIGNAVTFNNVEISGGVNFGSGISTVNGTLEIKTGGYVDTNPPTYGSASTLKYNLGSGTYDVYNEWKGGLSGAGVPFNVEVASGTTLSLVNAADHRTAQGSITINGALTADNDYDLFVKGSWTNNGTFTHNNRTVTFNGPASGTQTVSGSTTFYNLTLNHSNATTDFGSSSITIANNFRVDAGTMSQGTSSFTFTGIAGTIAGTNAKRFNDLAIASGASTTNTAGGNLDIYHHFTNDGTFQTNRTTTFKGSSVTHNLSGSGSTTFGVVDINGSNTVNAGTHSFSVTGNWSNTGIFNGGTATVTFNGAGDQSIGGSGTITFYNLRITNTSANGVTLASNITVQRTLYIGALAKLSAGATTLTLSGDASDGPDFVNNGTFNAGTGTVAFKGIDNQNARILGSAAITFNNVTITLGSGAISNAFGVDFYDHDTAVRATINGTLTLNQFTFVASEEDGSATGCAAPDPDQCDGSPFYGSSSTLRYNNSSAYDSGAEWWPNATCGSAGVPYAVAIDNSTTVNINAAFSNGGHTPSYSGGSDKLACGAVTISSGSTLASTAGTLTIQGNWANNSNATAAAGGLTHNNGKIKFNTGASQAIGGTARTVFYDLEIDNTGGVSLSATEQADHTLTLTNGRLTLGANSLYLGSSATAISGSFSSTRMIVADGAGSLCKYFSANGAFSFPVGDVTSTAEYSPASLNFTSGTYGSGAYTCVRVVDTVHPYIPGGTYLGRYWPVTQSGITGFASNAAFEYTDADITLDGSDTEADLYGAKFGDGAWTVYSVVDTANNRFTANGVTSFSDFTARKSGPLVALASGPIATPNADGILIEWVTAFEMDIVGFDVIRIGPDGERVTLNAALIPAETPGAAAGNKYSFTDATAVPGVVYEYWIEIITVDGRKTYGPAFASRLYRIALPVMVK